MSRKKRHHDVHHRLPTSRGGKNNPENLSTVHVNKHRSWHTLFGNESAQEIAKKLGITKNMVIGKLWRLARRKDVSLPINRKPYLSELSYSSWSSPRHKG